VGRLWQTNRIGVTQEHLCTAVTQMVMSQLSPYLFTGERKERRVVIDSIGDLEAGAHGSAERSFNFVYSLAQWFKNNGTTALLTGEMGGLFGSELTLTGRGVSHIADAILLLRYTELEGEIRRALTVLAARGSEHSKQVRECISSEKEGPRIGAQLHHTFSMLTPTRRSE